jgi:RNA polymerase sigma-70 factor (ECF subfamily)
MYIHAADLRDSGDSLAGRVGPGRTGWLSARLDFGEVYQQHFELVWRTLRRYGVPPASIDDAIQDVFLVVHARLSSFEGRSSLRTWTFGIARRIARDHRPSLWGPDEGVAADTLEALPDAGTKSPLAALEALEGARLLESLLADLSPKKRDAFILVQLEQMTVLEASQALGVNSNTVSSRVRSARQELVQALARLEARTDWNLRRGS